MNLQELLHRIRRKWMKIRLQPIRVFVFHHVSKERNPLICMQEDWTQLDQFKRNIENQQRQYTFISLETACDKLQHDLFRMRKYAVITTDDGFASVLSVMPWLEEKHIPLTLFVNTRYMDGDKLKPVHEKWLRELAPNVDSKTIAKQMYLSREQIWSLTSPLIEIGLHGHEHLNAKQTSESQFEADIDTCIAKLQEHPRFIRAFAYPWGDATKESLIYLKKQDIIPIVVRGGRNYIWEGSVDRECIDNTDLK